MADKPTRAAAMLTKCHDCTGGYADGKVSCQCVKCSLFPWMPYKDEEPDLEWLKYNPKKKGHVTWEDSRREIDDETRAALVERMGKAREARKQSDVDEEDPNE